MSAYDEGEEEGDPYEDITEPKSAAAESLLPKEPEPAPSTPQPPAGRMDCCCLLWSIIWLVVLVAFAWPLSVAMAALYGFVSPMITLIGLDDISESLLQAVHVGRECAQNVRMGRPIA
ncbi:Hypothetical predicted protein [Podarcis lilfordi]|uniref:Uncharacterized protein n=1 Tax=Podarcis lilfordi TaxID=74358 RepID=A0AA35NUF2_9SAUR|nr:Hypothetical predicted protein [Podarcis lilfordi]